MKVQARNQVSKDRRIELQNKIEELMQQYDDVPVVVTNRVKVITDDGPILSSGKIVTLVSNSDFTKVTSKESNE